MKRIHRAWHLIKMVLEETGADLNRAYEEKAKK